MLTTKRYEYMSIDKIGMHPILSNHRPLDMHKVSHYEKDIMQNGLLEPLVIWEKNNNEYYMVGGFHRLAAIEAIRKKPNSSMSVCARLVREKVVEGSVSAGNTGAFFATSLMQLRRIEGVTRPTIGTFTPGKSGVGFLLDVGANPNCKPHHLLEFGIMGSVFQVYRYNKGLHELSKFRVILSQSF